MPSCEGRAHWRHRRIRLNLFFLRPTRVHAHFTCNNFGQCDIVENADDNDDDDDGDSAEWLVGYENACVSADLRRHFERHPVNTSVQLDSAVQLQCLPPIGLPPPTVN